MTENTTYDQLKTQRHLSLEWRGINSTQICFEKIYHYLGDIRRYEYLVDGAFYCMKKCETDGIDVTNSITDVELPYFFSEKYKHKIPLELTDKEYKPAHSAVTVAVSLTHFSENASIMRPATI